MLLVLAFCVWLGLRINQARRQEALVRHIMSSPRNMVWYEHEFDAADKLIRNPAPPAPAWARTIAGEHFFLRPRMVSLIEYDEAQFRAALELGGIEMLNLANATDQHFAQLQSLTNLKAIDASSPFITRKGLADLAKLRQLEHIAVSSAWITDEDLKLLAPLKNLKHLNIDDTQVTGDGVSWIKQTWPQITIPTTSFVTAPDDLAVARQLADINVRFSDAKNGELIAVILVGKESTDTELQRLSALKHVVAVDLYETSVTAAGVKQFLTDRPDTFVVPNLAGPNDAEKAVAEALTHSGWEFTVDGGGAIQQVNSTNTKLMDDDLAPLESLSKLHGVRADSSLLTDHALKHLSLSKRLGSLSLPNAKLTDAGLEVLSGLNRISRISLNGQGLTDDALATLAQHSKLSNVALPGISLQSDGLGRWSDRRIREFDFSGGRISDTALSHLPLSAHVDHLNLAESRMTDEGLRGLLNWQGLDRLDLQKTAITDRGINVLTAIKSLRHLDLRETKVTEAGVDAMRTANPDCRVLFP